MLGARKVYPSSAIHASCVLPLVNEGRADAAREKEVLLAAIGDTIEVFGMRCDAPSPDGSGRTATAQSSSSFHFPARGHTFVVGSAVMALTPAGHQLVLVWTRSLELLLLRYQANLQPPPPSLAAAGEEDLWQPSWRHWCVCARVSLANRPLVSQLPTGLTEWVPLSHPVLLVADASPRTTVVAHLFRRVVHHLTVDITPAVAPLAAWEDAHTSGEAAASLWCWGAAPLPPEAPLFSGPLNPSPPTSSSSEMFLLPDGGKAGALGGRELRQITNSDLVDDGDSPWQEGAFYDLADEDKLPLRSVSQLVAEKRKVAERAELRERRFFEASSDAAWGRATLKMEGRCAAEAAFIVPVPSNEGDEVGVVDFYADAKGLPMWRLRCFASREKPVVRTVTAALPPELAAAHGQPYRAVPCDALSQRVVLLTRGGPGEATERAVSLASVASALPDIARAVPSSTRGRVNGPSSAPSQHEDSAIDAITLTRRLGSGGADGASTDAGEVWLLLADGSFFAMEPPPLMTATAVGEDSTRRGEAVRVEGLPAGFRASRLMPVGVSSNLLQYQVKLTPRYAMVADDISSLFVVDLRERRVVGGLAGDGALASACGGPAGTRDLFIAHANGALRRLTPSVPLSFTKSTPTASLGGVHRCGADGSRPHSSVPPTGGMDEEVLRGVEWPSEATHVATTVSGGAALAVAALADGRLALASREASAVWRLLFVSPLRSLPEGLVTACGVAHVADSAEEGVRLVVAVGLWCGSVSLLSLIRDTASGAWHLLPAQQTVVSPEVEGDAEAALFAPAPLQLVPAPSAGCTRLWVVRSSSGAVTVLCVALAAPFTGAGVAKAATERGLVAAWYRLTYAMPEAPTGGVGASLSPTATGIGPMTVAPPVQGTVGSLADRRTGVLLLQGKLFSLLFFSVRGGRAEVEEQLQMHLDNLPPSKASEEWVSGSLLIDVSATGGLACAAMRLRLSSRSTTYHADIPDSVLSFVNADPSLAQRIRGGDGDGDAKGSKASAADALVVRAAPTYEVTAASDALVVATSGACPGTYLSHMVYCPPSDTIVAVFNRTAAASASASSSTTTSSLAVTVAGATLSPLEEMETPGRVVLCAQTVPYFPSLPDTDGIAPQDLVLLGTHAQAGQHGASLLVVLPRPLRVVASVVLGTGPYDGVTDIAIHRSRRRLRVRRAKRGATPGGGDGEGEEEVLVAACCGKSVHVLRLVGYTLHTIASHTSSAYCFTVSLCMPLVSVGCGAAGELYLRLQGTPTTGPSVEDDSTPARAPRVGNSGRKKGGQKRVVTAGVPSSSSSDTDEAEEGDGSVSAARGATVGPTHGYPQRTMRLFVVGVAPSMNAPTVAQGGYRGTQVIHTDVDGSVVFSRVELAASVAGASATGAGLVGTNEATCLTGIYHCVRLGSPATMVATVAGVSAGDGHAALWRRRRRVLHWKEGGGVLRNANPRSDGSGPVRVLLPCQDGSLTVLQELPWAFAHLLMRLEQSYTDRLADFLAPAVDSTRATYGRPRNVAVDSRSSRAEEEREGAGGRLQVQPTCYGLPFRTTVALRNTHRTLPRQAVLSVEALDQIFRLWRAGCGARRPVLSEERPYCIAAEMERILWEDYGADVTLADCEEACAAW